MLQLSNREARIEAAAEAFPVGAKVLYRPVMGQPEQEATAIRSTPWMTGSGDVIVKIDSRAGGVSVDHLTLIGEAEQC